MKQDFMRIFGSMLHGFLHFSLVSWHGRNHAHSGMDGKATPAHDLNHVPCISFACGQELFNNFFRIRLSVVCCRIQQLTKIVRNLSTFIRVCISNLLICYRIQQKIHETHKIWHPSEQNYLFVHFNQS